LLQRLAQKITDSKFDDIASARVHAEKLLAALTALLSKAGEAEPEQVK
jgi:hypothetical protein